MKRLLKKKANTDLYHGTCVEYLRGITQDNVLIPNKSEGAGKNNSGDGSKFGGFNFLATTVEKALSFATYIPPQKTEAHVVLTMSLSENRLLPDNDDDVNAQTWQDSASSIQQVKVDGPIEASSFGMVQFYNKNTGEFAFEAPFVGWEEFYEEFKHLLEDTY